MAQAADWLLQQCRQAKLLGSGVASWPQTHQSYGSAESEELPLHADQSCGPEVWAAQQLNVGHQAMVGAKMAADPDQDHQSSC